jgi:hypothetical protein
MILQSPKKNIWLTINNQKSFDFLSRYAKEWNNIIIWWHPLVSLWTWWWIEVYPQLEALEYALLLKQQYWGQIVLWISNPGTTHHSFLINWVKKNKKNFTLKDIKPEFNKYYENLLCKYNYQPDDINVIFQNLANWYMKNHILHSNNKQLIKTLLSTLDEDEKTHYYNKCISTAAWFLKLTEKINQSAHSILLCFGSDKRCSWSDTAWWIASAQYILWVEKKLYFAYFDEWKTIPMIKCH